MPSYSAIVAADGDQNLAVSNTPVALTLPAHYSSSGVNSGMAQVQVRTAAVLYTLNGVAPTVADESTGTKLSVGDILVLETLAEMRNVQFIRATGTDGALFITYFKRID